MKAPQKVETIGGTWRLLRACLALSLLSIWFVFACIAYDTYRTAWREANLVASDVSLLLEQSVARDIERYDLSLKAFAKTAANLDIMRLPVASRNAALFADDENTPGLGGMLLVDKDGNALIESRRAVPPKMNVADRPFFRDQRDGSVAIQPFISHPLSAQLSKLFSVVLSRPRMSATGAFDGIVCAAIKIDYLDSLFAAVDLPPGSMIMLMHRDGVIMARTPKIAAGSGRKSTSLFQAVENRRPQAFVDRSGIDGVERLVAYKQVGNLQLYLAVGLSTKNILGEWRWRLAVMGLAFAGLSAIIVFLGIMLARELNRRTLAEQRLSELAATDSLTLLANRRRFDEVLQLEWRRAIRDSTPLSVIMIDGDFFKAFNDTYGHIEGDQALRLIAHALKRAVERPGDLVARFGGEEFVALLPTTDRDGANKIAEAMRQAIRDLAVPHAGSPLGMLTVSLGVASRWPRSQEAASQLVEAADAALYLAKAEGRDRTILDGKSEPARAA